MATCPFCAAELAVTRTRHLDDMDFINNGMDVVDFVCESGGSRFRHESVPRYPRGSEQWSLLLEDGREVCLPGERAPSDEERRFLRCSLCAHADARPMCTKEHVDADGRRLPAWQARPLAVENALESVAIEGVVVEMEVTRYRCSAHGEVGDVHRVIRREPGESRQPA